MPAEVRYTGGAPGRHRHERARALAATTTTRASAASKFATAGCPYAECTKGDRRHPAVPPQRNLFFGCTPPLTSRLRRLGSVCRPKAWTESRDPHQRARRRVLAGSCPPHRLPSGGRGSTHRVTDGRSDRWGRRDGQPPSPPRSSPPASSPLVHLSPALPTFPAPSFGCLIGTTPLMLSTAASAGRRSGDCQSGGPCQTVESAPPPHSRESLPGGFSFPGPTLLAAPRLSGSSSDGASRPSNTAWPVPARV